MYFLLVLGGEGSDHRRLYFWPLRDNRKSNLANSNGLSQMNGDELWRDALIPNDRPSKRLSRKLRWKFLRPFFRPLVERINYLTDQNSALSNQVETLGARTNELYALNLNLSNQVETLIARTNELHSLSSDSHQQLAVVRQRTSDTTLYDRQDALQKDMAALSRRLAFFEDFNLREEQKS